VELRNARYWICQLGGWLFYILINLVFFALTSTITFTDYILYLFTIITGIAITHLYRIMIKKAKAIQFNLFYQVIIIVVSSFIKAALTSFILALLVKLLFGDTHPLGPKDIFWNIINFSVVFFVWNIIYFGYHYFTNYKRAEIDNLRLEAAGKESELNSLKAQLNPHFMFNSMNSIRALVDEDPKKAKQAVTQLSNILRNSLLMNKSKEITLEEEMNLVKDYLDLEKIRYEERLSFELSIDPKTEHLMVPPLIIQGQVENAIKHGISKLEHGGNISISSKLYDSTLLISVTNTGQLNTERSATGLGFRNSLQRLQLMYGKKAEIKIREHSTQKLVETNIQIPLKTTHKT
jgi:two-component system, LytTR family, sensor kinase